ncbi:hypothetical protein SUT503_00480 [Streptococcus parasuis]|nr:hypothetical protein SUT503_00480 [Streptococcus parasuis]
MKRYLHLVIFLHHFFMVVLYDANLINYGIGISLPIATAIFLMVDESVNNNQKKEDNK